MKQVICTIFYFYSYVSIETVKKFKQRGIGMRKNDAEKELEKENLEEQSEAQADSKKKSKKKFYFFASLTAGVILLSTVFYFVGNNKFSADQQIAAFKEAVENNQVEDLQRLLITDAEEFVITEDNTAALITYLNDQKDKLDELLSKFQTQADDPEKNKIYASIDLIADGKAWLFFNDYRFAVTPAYIHPMANNDMTEYQINETIAEDLSNYGENGYGPFMPGHYNITAIFNNQYVTDEQTAELELYNTTIEEVVHSFDFPVEEIFVDSAYEDYLLYVNGEKTDLNIQGGEQSIGTFPIDGSVSLSIGKDFPWGEVVSLEEKVTEDEIIEFEIEYGLSEEARQALMEKLNTIFATYQEALTAKDASLLKDGVTDNLKEKLEDRVREVEKQYPDYEGKLVQTIYDIDHIADPAFDEKLNAYTITARAHHVFHEPNDNLGWLFRDTDKDEYTRTNQLTIIFDEEANEWLLDDYNNFYHTIPESREIVFEIE